MSDILIDPPVASAVAGRPFFQTLRIQHNGRDIATARWHSSSNAEGVAQLIDLDVAPDQRRNKQGTRLMHEVVRQIGLYFAHLNINHRRTWVGVEQKTQVVARAFLMMHGFHHMNTVDSLFDEQDLLIYVRTSD